MSGEQPRRTLLRLKDYDYSQEGVYFLTVCTYQKRPTLAHLRTGDPCGRPFADLTPLGCLTEEAIRWSVQRYGLTLDHYAIMPNHFHLLVTLPESGRRATARVAPTGAGETTTGRFIGAVKSFAANRYLSLCKATGIYMGPLWHRGYHDHVIRSQDDYLRVWTYIDNNPAHWLEDCYYREGGHLHAR